MQIWCIHKFKMTPEEVKGPIDKQNPTVYEFYEWSDVTLVDTLPVKKTLAGGALITKPRENVRDHPR